MPRYHQQGTGDKDKEINGSDQLYLFDLWRHLPQDLRLLHQGLLQQPPLPALYALQ